MAGQIGCDAPDCAAPADFLVGNMQTGDQLAFCSEHYVAFCAQFSAAAAQEVAAEPEPKSDDADEERATEEADTDEEPTAEAADD